MNPPVVEEYAGISRIAEDDGRVRSQGCSQSVVEEHSLPCRLFVNDGCPGKTRKTRTDSGVAGQH